MRSAILSCRTFARSAAIVAECPRRLISLYCFLFSRAAALTSLGSTRSMPSASRSSSSSVISPSAAMVSTIS